MSRYIEAEWLSKLFPDTGEGEWTYNATALGYIDSAPSIDIEPKRGEWRKHDEERDYCSVCKRIFKTRILTKQDKWTTYVDDLGYNFCPNCGADMRKGADDDSENI